MNDLLESAVTAHGGLERWSQVTAITVEACLTGALWRQGQSGCTQGDPLRGDTERQLLLPNILNIYR
jgi:hypothetical protein